MAALLAILLALVSVFVSMRGIPRSVKRSVPGTARRRAWRHPITGWGLVMRGRGREAGVRDDSGAGAR